MSRSLIIIPWQMPKVEPVPLTLRQVRAEYVRMLISILDKIPPDSFEHTCDEIEKNIAQLREEEAA